MHCERVNIVWFLFFWIHMDIHLCFYRLLINIPWANQTEHTTQNRKKQWQTPKIYCTNSVHISFKCRNIISHIHSLTDKQNYVHSACMPKYLMRLSPVERLSLIDSRCFCHSVFFLPHLLNWACFLYFPNIYLQQCYHMHTLCWNFVIQFRYWWYRHFCYGRNSLWVAILWQLTDWEHLI